MFLERLHLLCNLARKRKEKSNILTMSYIVNNELDFFCGYQMNNSKNRVWANLCSSYRNKNQLEMKSLILRDLLRMKILLPERNHGEMKRYMTCVCFLTLGLPKTFIPKHYSFIPRHYRKAMPVSSSFLERLYYYM